MNQQSQQGFTLIEVMIVVTIIGILASVSISLYKGYMARSTHTAAYSEIRLGMVIMETLFYDGTSVTLPSTVNLPNFTKNCSAITANSDVGLATGSITCTLLGNRAIHNKVITLSRNSSGIWSCNSTVASSFSGTCTGI